jgi:hypothetical protein
VLCPVRRPVTTLDCVLLKDSKLVFVVGLGPENNIRACLNTGLSFCCFLRKVSLYTQDSTHAVKVEAVLVGRGQYVYLSQYLLSAELYLYATSKS